MVLLYCYLLIVAVLIMVFDSFTNLLALVAFMFKYEII